jgi:signal transduction histidine kinase
VRALVDGALADIAPEQRQHVAVEVDPTLEFDADPAAFERIVSNLVINALRHGAPPVVVSAVGEDGALRLDVVDSGAGVPEDVRSRLFEQFARGSSTTGTPGTGLGLAIARSYAVAHGGDLTLEPNGAFGARFRLVLPGSRAQSAG